MAINDSDLLIVNRGGLDYRAPASDLNIPKKVSELENDEDFITSADLDVPTKVSELENDVPFAEVSDIPTDNSQLANGAQYITLAEVPPNLSQYTNDVPFAEVSDIPTDNTQLGNGAGYLTSADLGTTSPVTSVAGKTGDVLLEAADVSGLATVATTGDYDDLTNKPTIPTDNAQLSNGAGYLTEDDIAGLDQALVFKGTIDATVDYPASESTGDVWANTGTGTADAQWTGVTAVTAGDLIARGENNWSVIGASNTTDLSGYVAIGDNVSTLVNDAGYLTNATLPTTLSSFTNDVPFAEVSDIPTDTNDLANGAGYITIADVPTNNLQLTNGAGYITTADVPTDNSELTNGAGYATVSQIPTDNIQLLNGAGYITNANIPQDLGDLTNNAGYALVSEIPTDNADLANGAQYITASEIPVLSVAGRTGDINLSADDIGGLHEVATSGSYNDLEDLPVIPTDNLELLNGQGYITEDALDPYALITDIPTDNIELLNGAGYLTADDVAGIESVLAFKGSIDATVDYPSDPPVAGDMWVNTGSGQAISQWVGISQVEDGYIIARGSTGWTVVGEVGLPDLDPYIVRTGDNMTGDFTVGGSNIRLGARTGTGDFAGKVTSESTDENDSDNVLTTKDFVLTRLAAAEAIDAAARQLRVAKAGDNMTGDLTFDTDKITLSAAGSADFLLKATSALTLGTDPDSTLTTKSYVDDVADSISSVVVSDTAPSLATSEEGDLWWNSSADSGQLFVLYEQTLGNKLWTAASPHSGFVDKEGDNMSGDLTLGGTKILLDAQDGAASFASGKFQVSDIGELLFDSGTSEVNTILTTLGTEVLGPTMRFTSLTATPTASAIVIENTDANDPLNQVSIELGYHGNASFIGDVQPRRVEFLPNQGGFNGKFIFADDSAGNSIFSINTDGSATFAGDVGIGTTSTSGPAILQVQTPTTLSTTLDTGILFENTSTKTYPTTDRFTVTVGLAENIEIGNSEVFPNSRNAIIGNNLSFIKSAGNTQDTSRSEFTTLNNSLTWTDLNTCSSYYGIQNRFAYQGIDANGQTGGIIYGLFNTVSLYCPDTYTQTFNYVIPYADYLPITPNGSSTINVTNSFGTSLSMFNNSPGTKTINIGTHTFFSTFYNGWGMSSYGSPGTMTANITDMYGLRLRSPGIGAGCTLNVTNNYGISQEWAAASNYFAGSTRAASLRLFLEPENDANYTTVDEEVSVPILDEDGLETGSFINEIRQKRIYNGPEIDVKERIQTKTAALEAIKTAAEDANITTLADFKAAIATALADI